MIKELKDVDECHPEHHIQGVIWVGDVIRTNFEDLFNKKCHQCPNLK